MLTVSINHWNLLQAIGSHPSNAASILFDQIKLSEWWRVPAISNDDPSRISYSRSMEQAFDHDRRVKTTLGRYVRRTLKIDSCMITDSELAAISEHVRMLNGSGTSSESDKIVVKRGDDVTQAYADCLGSTSCMTGDKSKYTEIYAKNPEKVGMAIAYRGGSAVSRALVWNLDSGTTAIDRIYSNGDNEASDLLASWAVTQGYSNLRSAHCACSVTLRNNVSNYPYADTMAHCEDHGDTIVLHNEENPDCQYILDSQCGDLGEVGSPCADCGDRITDHDCCVTNMGGETICESCGENYSYCEHCNEATHNDDMRLVQDDYLCSYCFDDKASDCEECEEDHFTDDMNTTVNGHVCNSCLYKYSECEECGDLHKTEDTIRVGDEDICKDCIDQYSWCDNCGVYDKPGKFDEQCDDCKEERDAA